MQGLTFRFPILSCLIECKPTAPPEITIENPNTDKKISLGLAFAATKPTAPRIMYKPKTNFFMFNYVFLFDDE